MRLPGFVDLQVNGFRGVDFSGPELAEADVARAARGLFAEGTAAFLPTLVTSPLEIYRRNLPILATAMDEPELSGRLLGIHIEGPFISPEPGAAGIHDPACVRPPDVELLREMHELARGKLRMITIAAELPGAEELARCAVSLGITVSLGHGLATERDLARLARAGARALTHLGNGVPNLLPRHPNPIWAGLAEDSLSAMFVTDGHHLPACALKPMIRAKGVERTIVVSDGSHLAGLPPGRYLHRGRRLLLEESGRLSDPERGCLAGSSATMLRCMNHLASLGFLSLEDLVRVGFENPLRLIGAEPDRIPLRPTVEFDEDARLFRVA